MNILSVRTVFRLKLNKTDESLDGPHASVTASLEGNDRIAHVCSIVLLWRWNNVRLLLYYGLLWFIIVSDLLDRSEVFLVFFSFDTLRSDVLSFIFLIVEKIPLAGVKLKVDNII